MAEAIDLDDTEYTWPPGSLVPVRPLPSMTGPQLTALRFDSIEARVRILETKLSQTQRASHIHTDTKQQRRP